MLGITGMFTVSIQNVTHKPYPSFAFKSQQIFGFILKGNVTHISSADNSEEVQSEYMLLNCKVLKK